MPIKNLLKRALVGPHNLSDYISVGVPVDFKEPTVWCYGDHRLDVKVNCLLYDPAVMGIHFEEDLPCFYPDSGIPSFLEFMDQDKCVCLGRIKLLSKEIFQLSRGHFCLFEASEGDLLLESVKQNLISYLIYKKLQKGHRSFLSVFNPDIYRTLSAIFTHPRITRLLTLCAGEEKELTFPIDLYAAIEDTVFFGLRNSNRGVEYLVSGTRMCLSDVQTQHRPAVYSLGKFGGKPTNEMKLIRTEHLKLNIPEVFYSYVEVELLEVMKYEHQTIYQGKILNGFSKEDGTTSLLLAHVQLLRYLKTPMEYRHEIV